MKLLFTFDIFPVGLHVCPNSKNNVNKNNKLKMKLIKMALSYYLAAVCGPPADLGNEREARGLLDSKFAQCSGQMFLNLMVVLTITLSLWLISNICLWPWWLKCELLTYIL